MLLTLLVPSTFICFVPNWAGSGGGFQLAQWKIFTPVPTAPGCTALPLLPFVPRSREQNQAGGEGTALNPRPCSPLDVLALGVGPRGKRCSPGAHLPERNALTFLIRVHLSLSGVFTTQGVRRSLLPGTGSGASCPSPSDTDVHEEAGRKSSAKAKHRDSLGEMALPSCLQHREGLERAGVQAARMRGTQPVLVCRMRWAKKLCFSSSFSFYSPLVNVGFVPWVWSLTHLPAFHGPALGSFRLQEHGAKP